jgi:hypothetical protein
VNSYRALCVGSLVLLIVIAGCGGGSGVDFNKVVVTVSPTAATIHASGQVTLQATVTGTGAPSNFVGWSIAELKNNPPGGSGSQCNWLDTPPAGPCPDGTIQQVTVSDFQTVTYHAPSTSGTFHVMAEWSTAFNPVIIKDATSVITVSP